MKKPSNAAVANENVGRLASIGLSALADSLACGSCGMDRKAGAAIRTSQPTTSDERAKTFDDWFESRIARKAIRSSATSAFPRRSGKP